MWEHLQKEMEELRAKVGNNPKVESGLAEDIKEANATINQAMQAQ